MVGKGMERTLLYIESHNGTHTGVQAQRVKEIYYDFEADYIIQDIANAGIGIFDSLSSPTVSDERGITFPAMTVVGREFDIIDEKLREDLEREHTLGVNALPVIFPIRASEASNSQMAVSFRSSLQKKLWNFLSTEADAELYLMKSQKEFIKDSNDSSSYGFFLSPYVQTSLLINECIGLDMTLTGGLIRLKEHPGARKDRYSSVSYANFIISFFDKDLLRETQEQNNLSIFESMTMVM
jgi:hypothetical protein